jgi:LuxR family maltose regulon positive regulatory protein
MGEKKPDALSRAGENGHFVRPRVNLLLTRAVKKPLVIVCAGMGYGKTRAVFDFTLESKLPVVWVQLSELDNIGSRFWKSFTGAIERITPENIKEFDFPDTEDKMNRYFVERKCYHEAYFSKGCLIVLDDFHLVKDRAVINFVERSINTLPPNCSYILISREFPKINIP